MRDGDGDSAGAKAALGALKQQLMAEMRIAVAAPVPGAIVKVDDERLRPIRTGTERAQVLLKLGHPHGKIRGRDSERFTYYLESGKTAKIEFVNGRVTKVQ